MLIDTDIAEIRTTSGPKLLNLYALVSHNGVTLIDTGLPSHPEKAIAQALTELGFGLGDVRLIINTHADLDHHGGNATIRTHAPRALIVAHRLDQPLIESGQAIMRDRYGKFASTDGVAYSPEDVRWLEDNLPEDSTVDVSLSGGETIRTAGSMLLDVYHIPGHTWGHVLLWEASRRCAFAGDGILGRGEHTQDGTLFEPPTYLTVNGYVGAIQLLHALRPRIVLRGHVTPILGEDIDRFLSMSVDWVRECDATVHHLVSKHPGISLKELIPLANERLGPFVVDVDLAYPLSAHLALLAQIGRVTVKEVDGRRRWWPG